MVYATFDWDPNLGMDVSAFKVWAQAELQKIVAKYLVPLYQEKWHDYIQRKKGDDMKNTVSFGKLMTSRASIRW